MLDNLNVKLFADGADLEAIRVLAKNHVIKGFTTNPTLMRSAGVTSYELFAKQLLEVVPNLPISFEVFADDLDEMIQQAETLSSWGQNVYVKIPVTNTQKQFTGPAIIELCQRGIKLNVTAVMTLNQVESLTACMENSTSGIISVFAGRIADTGVDPCQIMADAKSIMSSNKNLELLWASTRELLNVVQADEVGCDIITVVPAMLHKLSTFGKDLEQYSLETVQMFYDDATKSGFSI